VGRRAGGGQGKGRTGKGEDKARERHEGRRWARQEKGTKAGGGQGKRRAGQEKKGGRAEGGQGKSEESHATSIMAIETELSTISVILWRARTIGSARAVP
jgi:hypothetical protein